MLRETVRQWLQMPQYQDISCQVLGPVPAAIVKVNNRYRYHMTLVAQNTKQIRALVAHLIRCAQQDKKNRGVSVSADVDPMY